MNTLKRKGGFTLLEVIIVIIIIGVLASLALPRFFRTVEYSRATEALTHLSGLRQAINRCYLQASTVAGCNIINLDVDDPSGLPNTHFTYTTDIPTGAPANFIITATRNTFELGSGGGGTITINQDGQKTGSGSYSGIQ